jgi:hypothetical protein
MAALAIGSERFVFEPGYKRLPGVSEVVAGAKALF